METIIILYTPIYIHGTPVSTIKREYSGIRNDKKNLPTGYETFDSWVVAAATAISKLQGDSGVTELYLRQTERLYPKD